MHLIDGVSRARRQRDRNPHYLSLKGWHSSKSLLSITPKYHKTLLKMSCKNPHKPLEDNRSTWPNGSFGFSRREGTTPSLTWTETKTCKSLNRLQDAPLKSPKNTKCASNLCLHLQRANLSCAESGGKKAIYLLYTISKGVASHLEHRQRVFWWRMVLLSSFQFLQDDSTTTAGRKIFHFYQSSLMDWRTGGWQRRILMAFQKKGTILTVMWICRAIAAETMKAS